MNFLATLGTFEVEFFYGPGDGGGMTYEVTITRGDSMISHEYYTTRDEAFAFIRGIETMHNVRSEESERSE